MLHIPNEEIERIKREVDLVSLVRARGVQLKRVGKNFMGLCPFHNDTTPSLSINPQKNLWNCFGACQTGGTVIDWVMKAEHVSFRYAVELLRERNGMGIAIETLQSNRRRKLRLSSPVELNADDFTLLSQVIEYYHATFKKSPAALAYLQKRGITEEAIEEFKIGFSDRTLGIRIPPKRLKDGAQIRGRLEKFGIIGSHGEEFFCGSAVFPISDENGVITGAYGRKIRTDLPKRCSKHLYLPGPHRGIFNPKCLCSSVIILCEAIIDALSFWVNGYRNVTSSYGTNGFTDEMLAAFISHGVKKVYIAYDADEAGDKAAKELAKKLWAHGIECYRVQFPKGMDANDFVRSKGFIPESLGILINNAPRMEESIAIEEESNAILELQEIAQSKSEIPPLIATEEATKKEELKTQDTPQESPAPLPSLTAEKEATKEEVKSSDTPQEIPAPLLVLTANEEEATKEGEADSTPELSHSQAIPSLGRQHELITRCRDYFHDRLSESDIGKGFLRERGLYSAELVAQFKLGFDDGYINQAITSDLIEELREIGFINDRGNSCFSQCLTVGLEDGEGNVISLYGYRVNSDKGSKNQFLKGKIEGILNSIAFKASKEMIITQNVLDAFSLWVMGRRNVSYGVSSEPVPSLLVDQFVRYGIQRAYLASSEKSCVALAERLGKLGVEVLRLEFGDGIKGANELLVNLGKENAAARLEEMIKNAVPMQEPEDEEESRLHIQWQGSRGHIKTSLLEYDIEVIGQERGVLRVLLTALYQGRSHTDKLDLYRSQARSSFAHTVSTLFTVPEQDVEIALDEILVAIRDLIPKSEHKTQKQEPVLIEDEEDKESGLAWLKDPKFFDQIPRDFDLLGYVGEDIAKQLIYCCASSRKQGETLSAVIRAVSATGKSDLMLKTATLMPPEDVLYLSELSKQALYYLTTERIRHKLVVVDERRGSEEADYAIRTLLSRGELRKAVAIKGEDGMLQTIIQTVKGPISYLESTADILVSPENENRCIAIYMDESREQTIRIHKAQREKYTKRGRQKHYEASRVIARHRGAQRLLKPCHVDIEYVDLLTFPDQWCRTRRDFPRFLLLLSTVAYLHQYQRKQYYENGELVVVAELKDYEIAYNLAPAILQPAVSDLGAKHTELLDGIDRMVEQLASKLNLDRGDVVFSRSQIANFLSWPHRHVRNYLPELVEMEYLIQVGSSARGTTFKYRRNYNNPSLTNPISWLISPEGLKERLESRKREEESKKEDEASVTSKG